MYSAIIDTKHLTLKGLSPANIRNIFANFQKSEVKNILGHQSEDEFLREEIKNRLGYSSYNRTFLLFLLVDKDSEIIIGRCGLHNWNTEHNRAEIGYVMNYEDYKRKGLMSEAVIAILKYGFEKLKLNRIEAIVGTNNIPSLRIMEKYGFNKEGILRKNSLNLGYYEDSIMFSLLSSEFKTNHTKV